MKKKEKEQLGDLIDKLYSINAFISGNYVTKIKKVNYDVIVNINELLGEMIGQFRNFHNGQKQVWDK